MAEEPDGVDEAFEGVLRIGLTAGGRVAEVIARAREQAAREAQATSQQQGRELGARLDAERSAARVQLAPTQRGDWWDIAGPEAIARVWETAKAWEQLDSDAGRSVERIRQEVRDRYGVDVDTPGGAPARVKDAIERRGLAEEDTTSGRGQAALEQAESARLLADADRADRTRDAASVAEPGLEVHAGEAAAGDLYDTAERRQDLATSLEGVLDSEGINARVLADTSQGRPASEAVTRLPTKAPKLRRAGRGTGRSKQRGEAMGR